MSRVGKKHIVIPEGVTVTLNGNVINVKGAKGELNVNLEKGINYAVEGNVIALTRDNNEKHLREMHGTTRALLANAITGVSQGFVKELQIVGIGYRCAMRGNDIVLNVGYSHECVVSPVGGAKITAKSATEIVVEGISKEAVGQTAALIRETRKPEPYGGKGIKYKGEFILRKEGKRAGKK
jgi:large subunit ribosomal protein L6